MITKNDMDKLVAKVAEKSVLITIISQYQAGILSEGQAINIIATAIGVTKEEAKKILQGVE